MIEKIEEILGQGILEKLFYELTKNNLSEFDFENYTFKKRINAHHYSISKKGIIKIRKKLCKKKQNTCNKCSLIFENKQLELDHIVPIILSGNILEERNHQLLCINCHENKTRIDLKVIQLLKSLCVIKSYKNNIISLIQPKKLRKLYFELFELIFKLECVCGNFGLNNLTYKSDCMTYKSKYKKGDF